MTPSSSSLPSLRRRCFRTAHPPDHDLIALVRHLPDNRVLANPPLLLVYQYLVHYIVTASEHLLQRPPQTLRVLDWGCGKGQVTYLLHKAGVTATPADRVTSGGGVGGGVHDSAFAQSTPLLASIGAPVVPLTHDSDLPFPDAAFDVVISMGVLEHVPDHAASLRELARVLRPGGLLFCFFLPATTSWTQRLARLRGDRYHTRFYAPAPTRTLVASAGLTLLDLWRRQLLPKNHAHYPHPQAFERADQWLTHHTPLAPLATNLEFLAQKPRV